ncbi:transcription factor MYBS3-like [Primulina eburnea]|uniref:transcription factor MYBS3-like n=1 Tax=Primulina eburnea TaxID=1245227 RepID=UPI003C6C05AD
MYLYIYTHNIEIYTHTYLHRYMCINCLNFDKMNRCSNSQCNSNSHNSRNCSTKASTTGIGGGEGGVRLFGVRLTDRSFIKKSASMGNLNSNHSAASASASADLPDGYHSDDLAHGSAADAAFHRAQRKRGTPWTEEEHRKFLNGLQKLGKGDWRGISRNYVPSRTPTQVASHAQKYFIRQNNTARRKKRSSLFDMAPDMEAFSSSMPEGPERCSSQSRVITTENEKHIVSSSHVTAGSNSSLPSLALTLKPAFMPLPFQLWPPNASSDNDDESHISLPLILNPAPVTKKEPVKEMVAISELNLEVVGTFPVEPSSLSLRLPEDQ